MELVIAPYSPRDRERFCAEPDKSAYRTEFARDRARIMYSSGLRRLGAKTQVLGPSTDDFVRTRLTHSLEVSQVGRTMALAIGADPDVVDAACQAHDLGHPPFGHNGERALDIIAQDIGGFEGNAQTFRLLTRLEPKILSEDGQPVGLNLTRASLDAVCKYPWLRGEGPDPEKSTQKYNCYREDEEIFTWMRKYAPGQQRCLEAQIMDISDDIAYSVHDIEDAIQTGAMNPVALDRDGQQEFVFEFCHRWYGNSVSFDQLAAAWQRLRSDRSWLTQFNGEYADLASLKNMTSHLIGRFVSSVTDATLAEAQGGPLHRYDTDLVIPFSTKAEIQLLKGMAVAYVMAPREVEPIYLAQRRTLFELADALQEQPEEMEPIYLDEYRQARDDQGRLRALIDQLAALTDTSANQWHGRLCGMFRSL